MSTHGIIFLILLKQLSQGEIYMSDVIQEMLNESTMKAIIKVANYLHASDKQLIDVVQKQCNLSRNEAIEWIRRYGNKQ